MLDVDGTFPSVSVLLLAVGAGYLIGSLPIADQVSRRRGVDIFAVGTGLAGASNVRRHVGKWSALVVLMGDIAKGVSTVLLAGFLGIAGPWVLLPALAGIVGHWNSAFTGFRGGDGVATLGGIAMALFPAYGVVSIAVAILVALGGQRLPYSSLLNIVAGYLTLAALSFTYQGDSALTLGVGGLCAAVLAHATWGHMKRRQAGIIDEELEEADGTPDHPQFRS